MEQDVLEEFALTDEIAFVTGAGGGIGRRVATGFAESGADVACFDLDGDAVEATRALVEKAGRRAVALRGDVTSAEEIGAAVAAATTALGALTVAFNCAGIASATPAEDMDPAAFRRMLDVNLTGAFLSAQAEARVMLAHRGGSIINVASMSGTIVNRGLTQAHYNASKAAVIHLSKSLAMEWARRGIRVNALSPGYTLTPMNERPEVAERLAAYAEDTPLGRIASVDDMVGPAVFLASSAARFVTGIDLIVDGGYVCW
jgi:NAD(P)-dependent dehydrogenase (short-subunit alcohol dehydrogenase family)